MRCASLVVANSQAGLNAWRVSPDRGRVIYNAFDEARLSDAPGACSTLEQERDQPFTVVMAARMTPQKDYPAVIEAARILEREAPGTCRFHLVGNGAEKAGLMRVSRALRASGAVIFRDAGLDALDAIRGAHVGVLMTNAGVHAEGCSNAIMEYMACGLPVVCSDSGGSAELVRDGRDGYVILPHDAFTLARRVAELRDDPGLRRAMGAAGRSRIKEDFGTERMVTEYLRMYEEAMGRRRGAGA